MASFRVSMTSTRFQGPPCPIRLQRRWARVHDIRFVTTRHVEDTVLGKYKAKLVKKAEE